MRRQTLFTALSIFANILLFTWLAWDSQYNPQNPLSVTASHLGTSSLVLASGLVVGSLFGYAILGRKGPGIRIGDKLHKIRPVKQGTPTSRFTGTPARASSLPQGTPPGPISKHTAYAVPPLSKPSTQPSQRQGTTSWSAAPKQWSPAAFRAQQQETVERPVPQQPSYPISPPSQLTMPRSPEPTSPNEAQQTPTSRPSSTFTTTPPGPSTLPDQNTQRPGPNVGPVPFWTRPAETPGETRQVPFQNNRPEQSRQPPPPYLRQPQGPIPDRPSGPNAPPPQPANRPFQDQPPTQAGWTDPVPRQEYPIPQKWLPPSASPVTRPPVPQSPGFRPVPRADDRPGLAGPQDTRRPLGYSMPSRTGTGPDAARYRPQEQPRPGPGFSQPSLNPVPGTYPNLRPSQTEARPGVQAPRTDQTPGQTPTPPRPTQADAQTPSSPAAPAGDMDWDTALDAILKTLRKDKVEDKT